MRWVNVMTLLVLAGALASANEKMRAIHFSKDDVGKVPTGWKAEHTGKGEGSIWKVVEDDTAPSKSGYALAQTAESPNAYFNICVAEDTSYKDVEVSVAFKALKGKNDQGGGIVWRYQDNNNYYIARMNPLEDNFRVYYTKNGRRHQLATREGLKGMSGEWHRLKIEMEGDHIECYLDGEKMLDVKDDTFKDAGKVGLWSKSDAQSHFDDFKVSGK